jgi:hypothetical protein
MVKKLLEMEEKANATARVIEATRMTCLPLNPESITLNGMSFESHEL